MNLSAYFNKGYNYTDYLKKIENQLKELENGNDPDGYAEHYSINLKRIERLNKIFELNDEQKEKLSRIKPKFKILTISEGWCGDASQIVPVVEKIAKELGIEHYIVLRDSNPELMDAYLTNGSKSIPIFIGVNEEGKEIFRFGPRPSEGMEILKRAKENPAGYDPDQFHKDLQLWYNKDKGNSIFNELYELISK
ncbi:MAG: thioredoxin family protein [Flavobacteriia bacterium]|nr:thioredoxin family protein [Flavobacteriia bacterium]